MIKIDWTAFVRQYIWFGYQCVNILDGKGNWYWSHYWSRRIIPIRRREGVLKEFILNEEFDSAGVKVYNPIN